MLNQGLTDAGELFQLRTGYETEQSEIKDLLLEPHDPSIDLDPVTKLPNKQPADETPPKLFFNQRFD